MKIGEARYCCGWLKNKIKNQRNALKSIICFPHPHAILEHFEQILLKPSLGKNKQSIFMPMLLFKKKKSKMTSMTKMIFLLNVNSHCNSVDPVVWKSKQKVQMRNEMSGQDLCVCSRLKRYQFVPDLDLWPARNGGLFPKYNFFQWINMVLFYTKDTWGHVTSSLALRIYRFSIKAWGAPR